MQSIAVLPFENITSHKDDDYLCAAIPIEITHLLSNYKNLRVHSYSSSIALTNNDLGQNEQDVNLLIKGSFLKIDGRIRITTQFIRSSDNTCVFSTKFDESSSNIFKMIDEISIKIIEHVNLKIINPTSKKDVSPKAYDFYLKGLHYWNLWDEVNFRKAISYFDKALEIDSEYVLAYVRLSNCWTLLAAIQDGDILDSYKKAKVAALKAIELDDNLLEAHLALALIRLINDLDILGAYHSLKKAFKINKHSPEAHYYYSFYLLVIGKYKLAIDNIEYALKYDPGNVQIHSTYGYALSLHGEFDKAENQLKRTLTMAPDSGPTYDALFWTYLLMERYEDAKLLIEGKEERSILTPSTQIALYKKLESKVEVNKWVKILEKKLASKSGNNHFREASIAYLFLGDLEKSSEYFEMFYQEKIGFIMALSHPAWKAFRESKTFYKYKKRLKLNNAPLLLLDVLEDEEDIVVINSSTTDKVSVKLQDLLYIEAQGTYSKIVWNERDEIKESLLRVSLSTIIDSAMNPNLYRCHKSFIINTSIVYKIEGNRKSMILVPKGHSFKIPVSRGLTSTIQEHLIIDDSSI